jgi:hypothetical protein
MRSAVRGLITLDLLRDIYSEHKSFLCAINIHQLATTASFMWNMKPFSDAEIVEVCILAVFKLPTQDTDCSVRGRLQVSDSTCARKAEKCSEDLF